MCPLLTCATQLKDATAQSFPFGLGGFCSPLEYCVRSMTPQYTTRSTNASVIAVGVLLGFVFLEPQDIHGQMAVLMNEYDINLPQLPDFDFSRLEAEWARFRSGIPEVWKFNNDGREFKVGEEMKRRGLGAKHPVILIPGIISTVRRPFHRYSASLTWVHT